MKRFFTAFAMFASVFSFGQANLHVQTDEIGQVNTMENLMRELSYSRDVELKVENIEGSAYLQEEFTEGIVALTNGSNYNKIPLRYNVYNEEIEFQNRKGDVFNINNPASIREVIIGESKFIYTDCNLQKENKNLFAEVISEGNVSLLKHHRLKLIDAKPAEIHKAAQPPRFTKMPAEYLIRKADGETHLFKNKKELVKLLVDKSEQINELIDQQKLSTNKEEDLMTIVGYYNGEIEIPLLKYHSNK